MKSPLKWHNQPGKKIKDSRMDFALPVWAAFALLCRVKAVALKAVSVFIVCLVTVGHW